MALAEAAAVFSGVTWVVVVFGGSLGRAVRSVGGAAAASVNSVLAFWVWCATWSSTSTWTAYFPAGKSGVRSRNRWPFTRVFFDLTFCRNSEGFISRTSDPSGAETRPRMSKTIWESSPRVKTENSYYFQSQGCIKLNIPWVGKPRRGVRSSAKTDVSAKRPYQTGELDAALFQSQLREHLAGTSSLCGLETRDPKSEAISGQKRAPQRDSGLPLLLSLSESQRRAATKPRQEN